MKRRFLLIVILLLIFNPSDAQLWKLKRYEIMLGIGPSQFFGDIGGYLPSENVPGFKNLTFKQTSFNTHLSFRYRFSKDINGRIGFTYGQLRANDQHGSNISRGYAATTSIFEQIAVGEYYLIRNSAERSYVFMKGRGLSSNILSVTDIYCFGGVGGVLYLVKPNDTFKPFLSMPSGYSAIIPVGVGMSTAFAPSVNLGLEFSGRYLFTDNIEGYTSQYSTSNDVYYFLNLTVNYKLKIAPR